MNEIRSFTAADAVDVADLYLKVMRGQNRPSGPALQRYFCEMLLENPWASPDVPSLVYLSAGKIVGFLGVIPRWMTFSGRRIRVAVTSQFMIDPAHRRGLPAVALLKRLFAGPQDLSYTDGAAEATHIVWAASGGSPARLYSFNWIRPLRPLATAQTFFQRAPGWSWLKGASRSITRIGDATVSRLVPAIRPRESRLKSRPVSPEELFDCVQEIGWREPLHPAYEPASFKWLLSHTERTQISASRDDLRLAVVRDPASDTVCGWYVYIIEQDGGPASLMQIGVRRRDNFDEVFGALVNDAWNAGASLLKGQTIPQYGVNLSEQGCLFRQMNTSVLFQTRDPMIEAAIFKGHAAFSRLDGESWMHFSSEEWV